MLEILFAVFLIVGIAYFIGGRKAARAVANTIVLFVLLFFLIVIILIEDSKNPGYAAALVITLILAPSLLFIKDKLKQKSASK